MNVGHRTIQWAPKTRFSSLPGGYFRRSKQQRSFVRTFLLIRCDAESLSSYRVESRIYKGRVDNAPTGALALPASHSQCSDASVPLRVGCCLHQSCHGSHCRSVCGTTANPNGRSPWQPTLWRTLLTRLWPHALAAAGVLEHVVVAMARWSGPAVRIYMAEAPLASSYNLALLAILSPTSRWKQHRFRRTWHSSARSSQISWFRRLPISRSPSAAPSLWTPRATREVWIHGIGVLEVTWRTRCGWRFSSAPFCIWPVRRRNGCVQAASKRHRLLRRKRRSKWKQYRHPTRVGGLRHKWECHLCPSHNWHVQLCPHSFLFAPQPSDSYYPCVLHNVSVPCKRVRQKGKVACRPHTHLTVLVTLGALPVSVLR